MKYKLTLDFHFTRFWAFSLLAVIIASAVAYNSFNMSGRVFIADMFLWITIILIVVWLIFMIWFLMVYFKLRSKLKD